MYSYPKVGSPINFAKVHIFPLCATKTCEKCFLVVLCGVIYWGSGGWKGIMCGQAFHVLQVPDKGWQVDGLGFVPPQLSPNGVVGNGSNHDVIIVGGVFRCKDTIFSFPPQCLLGLLDGAALAVD